AKLVTSEVPILVGAPPAEDSEHAAGRRLFANGQSDHCGLPRQKQSMATTRIKGKSSKKAPMLPASTISLSEDEPQAADDLNVDASPVHPAVKPPPSREFIVVQRPTGQKKVDKKVDKKADKKVNKKVNKEVISLMSSDGQSGSEGPDEDLDEAPND
ncbi:hypothetical protein DFH29DRAFT_815240, partial [Suillus ampliporus]